MLAIAVAKISPSPSRLRLVSEGTASLGYDVRCAEAGVGTHLDRHYSSHDACHDCSIQAPPTAKIQSRMLPQMRLRPPRHAGSLPGMRSYYPRVKNPGCKQPGRSMQPYLHC